MAPEPEQAGSLHGFPLHERKLKYEGVKWLDWTALREDPASSSSTQKRHQGGASQVSSCCLQKNLSLTYDQLLPSKKSIMLTGEMQLWHGLVIAGVSLFLQTCLLMAINYLLSRHIAQQSEQILKKARPPAQGPGPASQQPPAAKENKETWTERSSPMSAPCYRDASSTSSESADSTSSSDSSPPTCQVTKEVNYTQVVFSAPGGLRNDSALDYENIKEATDYVNVNPKSHKPDVWTFVNSAVSEPVEYTQVAV